MDIQSVITHVIEAFFMSFVALLVFQFITGLFVEYNRAITAEFASSYAMATAQQPEFTPTSEPVATPTQPTSTPEFVLTNDPWQEPQFAQLPDPWELTDITPNSIPQPVVLEFPTLKLLPQAPQMQPKARATTKSSTAKRTTKPTNKAATEKSSKSRKKAAA